MSTVAEQAFKSRVERHPERKIEEGPAILAQGLVAHVGFVENALPYVIPMSYHYEPTEPDVIYLHGSPHSRALKLLATGVPVCIEVTLLEGLVYSRAAMFHSMNYRSALAFGKGAEVTDAGVKQQMFNAMIGRYFAGRTPGEDYLEAPDKHLEQTLVVKVEISALSAKQREGGPKGPEDDLPEAPGTAGIAQVPTGCPFHAQSQTITAEPLKPADQEGHGHV